MEHINYLLNYYCSRLHYVTGVYITLPHYYVTLLDIHIPDYITLPDCTTLLNFTTWLDYITLAEYSTLPDTLLYRSIEVYETITLPVYVTLLDYTTLTDLITLIACITLLDYVTLLDYITSYRLCSTMLQCHKQKYQGRRFLHCLPNFRIFRLVVIMIGYKILIPTYNIRL